MYRKQVRRRRAVLVALIVLSLVLLSSHFSEAESGPLHTIQRGVATVFAPVGELAERALKPARDLVNWFDETFDARGENADLEQEVAELRAAVTAAEEAEGENQQFRKTSSSASCSASPSERRASVSTSWSRPAWSPARPPSGTPT
jgi:cell shape-determining protein MreC